MFAVFLFWVVMANIRVGLIRISRPHLSHKISAQIYDSFLPVESASDIPSIYTDVRNLKKKKVAYKRKGREIDNVK